MDKAYDRNVYVMYQKPLVQATGIVVLSHRSEKKKYYYGEYEVIGAYGYKSVQERKDLIKELSEKWRIDNNVVTISIIPN